MAADPADDLFQHYKGLIGYAVGKYQNCFPVLDPEDLFQDGCLMMVEFFDGRFDTKDEHTHNTFKKSLFFWLQRTVSRRMKQTWPTGKAMVRLNKDGGAAGLDVRNEDGFRDVEINIDRMLAVVDACVLTKLYAKELVAELRRLLKGMNLTIFDMLVRSLDNGDRCIDIVRRASRETSTSAKNIYGHMQVIRDMATTVLSRPA